MMTLIATIFAFLLLVSFHEYGHFFVARLTRVKVLCFSVGFGKTLIKWTDKHGTLFKISIIPLGGYVKMLNKIEFPDQADNPQCFENQSFLVKSLIVLAGPTANIILAIILITISYMLGTNDVKPFLAKSPQNSALFSQLKEKDLITKIDDKSINNFTELYETLLNKIGDKKTTILSVKSLDGYDKSIAIKIGDYLTDSSSASFKKLGIVPYKPKIFTTIATIVNNSPAEKFGLKKGDKILAINGEKINSWQNLVDYLQAVKNLKINLTYSRAGISKTINIVLQQNFQKGKAKNFLGIIPLTENIDFMLTKVHYNLFNALFKAITRVINITQLLISSICKMFTGEISTDNIGGPISIANSAGKAVNLGLSYYLTFLGILNISLAIINLLPIPILDGGQLVIFCIEAILGKPLNKTIKEYFLKIGVLLILLLLSFAFFNDITNLLF